MIKLSLIGFFVAFSLYGQAQVGVGTISPSASAALDITSTTKGFLPPRMTISQRNSIASPVAGLMVYQTDGTSGLYYYNGSAWIYIINSASFPLAVANGGTGVTTSTGSGNVVLSTSPTLVSPTLGAATATSVNNITISRGGANLAGNVAVGETVLSANSSGQNNTVMGHDAMKLNSSGWSNTVIGKDALNKNLSGSSSVAIGYQALFNSTASSNDALGYQALLNNSSGTNNVSIGQSSLKENALGNNNTVVGFTALAKNSAGSGNVVMGHYAGRTIANGSTELTGISNSVLIGADTRANGNSETNQIVIGYGAIGAGSNTVQLGNSSITNVYTSGRINSSGVVSPSITGGSGTSQSLTYKTTSGVGATGADHIFQVGNNGATEAMRITNAGRVGIGTNAPSARLDIRTSPASTTDPGEGYLGVGAAASTAASAAGAGAVRYSTSSGGVLEYSNGSVWNTLSSSVQRANLYATRLSSSVFTVNGNTSDNTFGSFTSSSGAGVTNFNSSTGVYTAPRSGLYNVSAGMSFMMLNASSSGVLHFLVMKGGITGAEVCNQAVPINYSANQVLSANISCSVPLSAGETLQIKFHNWTGTPIQISLDPNFQGRYFFTVTEN